MMTYRTAEILFTLAVAFVVGPMMLGTLAAFWMGSGALLLGMAGGVAGLLPFFGLLMMSEWVMGRATR